MRVVVLGAGRHGRVLVEAIALSRDGHEVVGYLDDSPELKGESVDGVPVLGPIAELSRSTELGLEAAVVGTGNLRRLDLRRRFQEAAETRGLRMLTVVHPTAFVSPSARVGDGVFLGPNVVLHTNVRVGGNVVVYTASTIDHDGVLGDHAFLGPGVRTAGEVRIDEGAYVGPGVVIGSGCRVGTGAIVGAGSVIVRDVPADVFAFGSPCRVRSTRRQWETRSGNP